MIFFAVVEIDIDARLATSRTPFSLFFVGTGNSPQIKPFDTVNRLRLTNRASIDNNIDIIDGDTGLSDIGGNDGFRLSVVGKNLVLLLYLQLAVQRKDNGIEPHPVERYDGLGDLSFSRLEN